MSKLFALLDWRVCYALLLVEALVLSWLLTPLAARLGERLGMVAIPGGRRAHRQATARSGGIALFAAFWLVAVGNLAAAVVVSRAGADAAPFAVLAARIPRPILMQFAALGVGALWIFLVGLWDDWKPLRPSRKLAFQMLATLPLLWADIRIVSFLPRPWMGDLLTVGWVVLLMNSFNFLDNMDGLTAGVAAICSAVLAWISYGSGEWLMTGLFVILCGVLLGFLRHNFSPARVFMGDCGSQFIGYMIGVLTVLATYYKQGVPTRLPVLTPLIVLGVPLFDTCSVLWIRWRSGRPLSQGDRNHFSHRLVNLGMTERGAVVFIYLVTLCVALGALLLRELPLAGALLVALQTAVWFVIIYWIERLGKRAAEK